jgi:uncharacterized protein (TIGR01244 family)
VPGIARAGYAALICMRPDGESPDQPNGASIEASARKLGLAFHYLPVLSGAVSEQQAARLKQLLDLIEGPVLAYCASGNRCALAYNLSLHAAC